MEKFFFCTFQRWKYSLFVSKKLMQDDIFFTMEYHVYWVRKSSCFELFEDWKHGLFLIQEIDCKMKFSSVWNTMFSDYRKVLVLNFSEMENTVFIWFKKLMERSCLLGICICFFMNFAKFLEHFFFTEHLQWLLLEFVLWQLTVRILELYFT